MATEDVDPRFVDLDAWPLASAMEAMYSILMMRPSPKSIQPTGLQQRNHTVAVSFDPSGKIQFEQDKLDAAGFETGRAYQIIHRDGRRAELLEFLRWDAEVARVQEPGTLRFDVWDVPDEPDAFYVYEAYVDEAAFDAHREGEPFKRFVAGEISDMIEPVTFVLPFANSRVSIVDG